MEDLRKRLDNFLKEQGYSPIDVTVGEKKTRPSARSWKW